MVECSGLFSVTETHKRSLTTGDRSPQGIVLFTALCGLQGSAGSRPGLREARGTRRRGGCRCSRWSFLRYRPAVRLTAVVLGSGSAGPALGHLGTGTVEPLEYYRRFLKENCRPDGRELGEFRATTVNIGSITTADGSALVKLGNTTVICGVKAELAAPSADAANKGYIVPNVELPSLCSTRFRSGPPGEEAQAASQFIADVIENSQIIAKEDLCIANGKLAWVLYCDIICLDYDGNILDASAFALLAALKNVQLPSVTINEETGLSQVNFKQKNPLIIRKHPVATSFAIFDDTLLIVDPTAEEEDLATGTVTVVTDDEGKLCSLHKPGGSPLTGAKLQDCITRAITRHKEVKKLIDKVIESIRPK
ncbi:exosome complex component RRP43 isoform X1 [Heliangelus exortis]|uniref:exosome complex component RRP43 isoform X1 n=1 Tax=Heliangelus exortis TaxID=472823 RepID=UPI003A937BEE